MNLNNNKNKSEISSSKNVARGSFEETKLDDGFFVLTYQNESNELSNC